MFRGDVEVCSGTGGQGRGGELEEQGDGDGNGDGEEDGGDELWSVDEPLEGGEYAMGG